MATNISTDTVTTNNVVVTPQVNKPGSPTEGQIISGTGTGDIAKGVYRYTGGSWESLDNAQGDLNTLRLIMSTDTNANDFNAAKSSTGVAGNTNAVPHETSAGTGMLGALEIPSTGGDALLTEFDANRVLRYYSAGANNNNDYFGITVDVPAWCRGENIVVEFQYRTEEASDTTSNGDFQFSVWDKSNGVSTTQASTLTTGTTISAGSNILMTAKTNLAVGDRIWFETGGTGSTVGGVANGFTEAYITEISSTDNNIKVSQDVQVIASGIAVTGWLSSKVEGLLPEADSDTNKIGKSYSLQVKTEEDTDQIVLWISNKSATTNVIELFFDGILVSANKFLQASTNGKPEMASYVTYAGNYSTYTPYYTTENQNTFTGQYGTWQNGSSTSYTHFEASCRCKVTMSVWQRGSGAGANYTAIIKNDLSSSDPAGTGMNSNRITYGQGLDYDGANCTAEVILEPGDTIRPAQDGSGVYSGQEYLSGMNIMVEPLESESIILESQDEIFTDWVSDGTFTSHVTASGTVQPSWNASIEQDEYFWRRVGSNMEILINFYQSSYGADGGTGNYMIALPAGYSIDLTKLKYNSTHSATDSSLGVGGMTGSVYMSGQTGTNFIKTYGAAQPITADGTKFGLVTGVQGDDAGSGLYTQTGNFWGEQTTYFKANYNGTTVKGVVSLPIQGWNTNFNPLLSMPLVEIGNLYEEYRVQGGWTDATSFANRPYLNSTLSSYTEGINTIDKFGVITNDSTKGWNFQATQKVTVTASMSFGNNSTLGYFSIIKTPTAPDVFQSTNTGNNDAVYDGYRMGSVYTSAAGETSMITVRVAMSPGEYLYPVKGFSGIENANYICGVNLFVEKDYSNTNMAHIIKPAVAYAKDIKASTANGDGTVHGAWRTRTLQTLEGESWFMTLSSNVITLEPGTYKIKGRYLIARSDAVSSRLYSTTDSATLAVGETGSVGSGDYISQEIECLKTFTASHSFVLQYQCQTTAGGTDSARALGMNSAASGSTESWCAASVRVEKLK